jgi:hypothetical protein
VNLSKANDFNRRVLSLKPPLAHLPLFFHRSPKNKNPRKPKWGQLLSYQL